MLGEYLRSTRPARMMAQPNKSEEKKMQQPQLTPAPVQLVLCTSPQAAIPTPQSEEVWRWRHSECNLSSCLVDRGIFVLLSRRLRNLFQKVASSFLFLLKKKKPINYFFNPFAALRTSYDVIGKVLPFYLWHVI